MRESYINWRPNAGTLDILVKAGDVIDEYAKMGYKLTLRQLYYQFVSRDWLQNTQKNYKRLGHIVNQGRLAGFIDWEAIEDPLREINALPHYAHPHDVIKHAARWWGQDLWVGQEYRCEVWIEKNALNGIFLPACQRWDVPVLVCRGYTSQSAMYEAGQRFKAMLEDDDPQVPRVFYFGDHDPSGLQMTEDINNRLAMFTGEPNIVERVALTREQIRKYKPPPNPAKDTDSRFKSYVAEHGTKCWELDALDPPVLVELVESAILSILDEGTFDEKKRVQEEHRGTLIDAAKRWDAVRAFLKPEDKTADDV